MPSENTIYTTCALFDKPILFGQAYISITHNIEYAEFEITTQQEEIEIIESNELISLCNKCGNAFDATMLSNILRALPRNPNRIGEN